MKALPLRTSLTLFYTLVIAVLLTTLGVGYHAALVNQLEADAASNLEERARGLHGYLQFRNGEPVLVYNADDADEAAFIADATRYYQVYDAGTGRLLVQSPGMQALGLTYTASEVRELGDATPLSDLKTDRGRIRLFTSSVTAATGEKYIVQVGELLDRVDATLAGFDRILLWRLGAGLVAAALVGRWLAGRALSPLGRLARDAHAIDIRSLHSRLPTRGAGDELDQVVVSFNEALGRVERSVLEMRQFSSALAHELRTPLAILRGEAELALRTSTPPERIRQTIESQIDEFDRLTRLINQILTLARAESGDITLARDAVDLSVLSRSVTEQMEPVAEARSVALTCSAADNVVVTGDAGWLQRLLLILIDNAIKFTPGGGRVGVELSSTDGRTCLAVSDTGPGVRPEARLHLFEPFYRGDAARATQADGAGLGLALARWIADRHGASIDVSSNVDGGSTFALTFINAS